MKLFIYIVIALIIAAFIANIDTSDTDYLLLSFSDWSIQTSLSFFIILLILFLLVFYFSVRGIVNLIKMPEHLAVWRKQRQLVLSERSITRGLYALTEGKWKQAEKYLIKGAPYSSIPMINYLGAARAAQNQGAISRRDEYLKTAYGNASQLNVAVGLTQAELQISNQQVEQALATLTHLHEELPGNKQIKLMLLQTYQDLKDWKSALKILKVVSQNKLLNPDEIKSKYLSIYAGLLCQYSDENNLELLNKQWLDIPEKLRREEYLLYVYVSEKLKHFETADCEILLRKALKRKWDQSLIRLYGQVQGSNNDRQYSFAEHFLKTHPKDHQLLLTLGKLSIRNNLWGKARDYLEQSIEVFPTPDAYRELAMLLENQGEYSSAVTYYQKGLELASNTVAESIRIVSINPRNALVDESR